MNGRQAQQRLAESVGPDFDGRAVVTLELQEMRQEDAHLLLGGELAFCIWRVSGASPPEVTDIPDGLVPRGRGARD